MSFPARLNDWLGKLPSTNARIAVTLLCVFGTAVRYWVSTAWVPSGEWLMFLAGMSSVDGAVFFAKRKTDANHVEAQAKARATVAVPKVDA